MECGVWTDKPSKKDVTNKEDRQKLGLAPLPKGRSAPTTPPNESSTTYEKLDVCVLLYYAMICLLSIIGFSRVTFFIVLSHGVTETVWES